MIIIVSESDARAPRDIDYINILKCVHDPDRILPFSILEIVRGSRKRSASLIVQMCLVV